MHCDIFRAFVISDLQIVLRCLCRNSKFRVLRAKKDEQKIRKLYELYTTQNSFLYSSLNMELVYAILRGINVCLREINTNTQELDRLGKEDFKFTRIVPLKQIEVINREFFEKIEH